MCTNKRQNKTVQLSFALILFGCQEDVFLGVISRFLTGEMMKVRTNQRRDAIVEEGSSAISGNGL